MATVKLPYELQGGQKAIASQVMANFEAVLSGFNSINKELEKVTTDVDGFNKKPTIAAFTIFPSLVSKAPVGAYPLWTGEQVINARTLFKEFWEKAMEYAKAGYIRTVTQAEYDAEVEEYGQTGAFVIDELNGHIRLPKITRFISALEDIAKLGEPQKDGIPELSGEFFIAGNAVQGADASGIFKKKAGRTCTGYGMGAASMPAIEIDISEQINITEEVQPRHVRVAWYIQVANNIADISTLDTAAIADLLNNALGELSSKKAEAEATYTALALEKTNEIGATVNDLILGIQGEASVQVKKVTDEGDKQVARVIASGSSLVDTGTTQAEIITIEGTKQAGLVQQVGATLVESGNAQVARVSAEGNMQVARIVETVTSEVDDKLVSIKETVQKIYDAGNSQLAEVNQAGATQVSAINTAGIEQTENAKSEAKSASLSAQIALEAAEKASNGNIGDVKFTLSKSVPNGGVWCDGAIYTQAQFPAIYQMLIEDKLQNTNIESYDEHISTYGQCGYFGLDTSNTSFRVPLLKDLFLEAGGADVVPDFISPGLPEISALFSIEGAGFQGDNNTLYTSGAAENAGSPSDVTTRGDSNIKSGRAAVVSIRASKYDSIYGNSHTVQPAAVKYRAYVVLYTAVAEASEVQAAQFLTGLSGKADTNLTNVTDWTGAANQVYPGSKKLYNFLTIGGEAWTSPAPGWLKITYKAVKTGTALTSISGEYFATPIYAVGAMHTSLFPVNTGDVVTATLQDGNLIVHESVFTYAKGC